MSTRSSNIKFDIGRAKNFMKYIINVNRENAANGIKKTIAVELIGDAGLGKTSAALQLAHEMGVEMVKLNLSQIEEIGDLVGFPIKKYEIMNPETEERKMTSEKQLTIWVRQGWMVTDRDPVMSYAAPEWIANRGPSGILLLDDWSRADK